MSSSRVERMSKEIPMLQTSKATQIWRCDVCKVRTFPSYKEACDHEEACRKVLQETLEMESSQQQPSVVAPSAARTKKQRKSSSAEGPSTITQPVHPYFATNARAKNKSSATSSSINSSPSRQSVTEETTSKRKTVATSRKTLTTLPVDTWTTTQRPKRAAASRNKSYADDGSHQVVKGVERDASKEKGDKKVTKMDMRKNKTNEGNELNRTKNARKKNSNNGDNLARAFALGGACIVDKVVIAEQRALLEFMAKRRDKERLEREKRERQCLRLQKERSAGLLASDIDQATLASSKTICTSSKKLNSLGICLSHHNKKHVPKAPHFPVPSHVISVSCDNEMLITENAQSICKLRFSLIAEYKPMEEDVNLNLFPETDSFFSVNNPDAPDSAALLQMALATIFVPPATQCSKQSLKMMWVDRYYNDGCGYPAGASMNAAQQQLKDFIERFMVERQKAEEGIAERRLRTQGKRYRKNLAAKKSVKYENDDLWDDDDEDELVAESSLCLLTGPVGCGKSGLVHAVAKQLGCRKVLELHTGMKRGAVAMKRCVEEATKSHSTLDMLHNKKQKKSDTAAFFQKRQELVDSESEEGSSGEMRSPVTVILIDEVDNLFEGKGDTGFWTALGELYKRSKCPIILTSNSCPKALSSSTFRFVHIEADRPTPVECVSKLREIAAKERFKYRQNENDDIVRDRLEQIAILGNCDLRHIANELQTFAKGVIPAEEPDVIRTAKVDIPCSPLPSCHQRPPQIDSVNPRSIVSNEYSLLIINGLNFLSIVTVPIATAGTDGYPCNVYIGDQLCPAARVLHDSYIIAVVSPFWLPPRLDKSGMYRGTHVRSISAAYPQLTICGVNKLGLLSTSSGLIASTKLPNKTKVTVAPTPFNLEYHFPANTETSMALKDNYVGSGGENDDGSSMETEFELTKKPTDTIFALPTLFSPQVPMLIDSKTVSKLLQQGINAWCSVHGPVQEAILELAPMKCEADELRLMDELYNKCSLTSDAALLESVGLTGMPHLAGSCRGFGFDLTDEYPKRTDETSKPPSEERLFALGWKDNSYFYGNSETYVTMLTGSRERNLLKLSESAIRGLSPPIADVTDDEETEEFNINSDVPEEDMLLPANPPECVLSLPFYLSPSLYSPESVRKDHSLLRRKTSKTVEAINLFCDFIFTRDMQTRMVLRAMSRDVDPLISGHYATVDSQLFLDYLPLMRCMAVHECSSEFIFNAAEAQDPDAAATMTNRLRSTRRSKKLGREHYLERVVPSFVWQQSDTTAKEVGERLADSSLLHER